MPLWLKRALLVVGLLLAGLGLFEVAARTLLRKYADAQFFDEANLKEDVYRVSPTRGYEMIPNVMPDVNSVGMRGVERAQPKPAGTYTVVALGDSITFGIGVKADETFAAVLERQLQERYPERAIEVLNAGVIGYNTEQEFTYLREIHAARGVDAVVVGYCPNDIFVTPMVLKDGDKMLFYRPGKDKGLYNAFLVQNSALYRLAMYWRERRAIDAAGERFRPAAGIGANLIYDETGNYTALRGIAAFAREHGMPFAVIMFPYMKGPFLQYEPENRKIHVDVGRVLGEEKVPFIDLLQEWAATDYKSWLRPEAPDDFVHPSKLGHVDAARKLAAWFFREKFLE